MVAILLSTYNGELFLKEQIDSFFAQSYKDWQLYVRDDGSTDKTVEIIREYEKKNPSKVHIVDDITSNLGAGESFMHLVKEVDADYYMFSDQDDVWLSNKIELTITKLQEIETDYGKDVGVGVFTDLTVVDSELNVLMPSLWKGDNRHPEYVYDFYKQWTNRHASYGCTQMFNRAAKHLILPYRQFEGVMGAHDNWLEYVLIKLGKYDFINTPTILYRQHGMNIVGANYGKSYSADIKEIIDNPLNLFQKLKKDYKRSRLMPFRVSYLKVLWYRFYQSVLAIIE